MILNKLIIKNLFLAILLILLLSMLMLFRDRSPFGNDQTAFAAEPGREITRIEFSGGGEKLLLEREGEKWMVNNTHEARKSGISFIGRILTEIQIKSPVSPQLFDEVLETDNPVPVKVRIYEGRKLARSFFVYKTNSNIYGNVMKMSERSKPFIVHLPGYEGDIGSAFTTNELFWLPFTIFRLLPSEIGSVEFENYADTASSFALTRSGSEFVLSGPGKVAPGWDTSRVHRYVSYFTLIPFERWAFDIDDEQKQKIEAQKPLFRISVVKTDGIRAELILREKVDELTGLIDSDRLWGRTDTDKEFILIRYFDIDPLLKKRTYFYPE